MGILLAVSSRFSAVTTISCKALAGSAAALAAAVWARAGVVDSAAHEAPASIRRRSPPARSARIFAVVPRPGSASPIALLPWFVGSPGWGLRLADDFFDTYEWQDIDTSRYVSQDIRQ